MPTWSPNVLEDSLKQGRNGCGQSPQQLLKLTTDLTLNTLVSKDNRQEDAMAQPSLSATLPSDVTLASLPSAREAEIFPIAK